jgi:hypothetical protein
MSYAMLATLRRLYDLTDDNPTTQNYLPSTYNNHHSLGIRLTKSHTEKNERVTGRNED